MGKDLNDEEILEYLKDGWHFHRKKVSNYEYIIRRKSQATRSHGPFNEELWSRIKSLEGQLNRELFEKVSAKELEPKGEPWMKRYKELQEVRREFKEGLAFNRAFLKVLYCEHRDGGYCTRWIFLDEGPGDEQMEKMYAFFGGTRENHAKKVVDDEEGIRWMFRSNAVFCEHCSLFKPNEEYERLYNTVRARNM